jgi:hypothetical protein
MFLNLLTQDEKKAFLGLAYKVAMADNIYHEQEQAMMEYYEYESGMKLDSEKDSSVEELCSVFQSKTNKAYCMIELLSLAFSDSEFHQDEKKIIDEVSERLNIDDNFIKYTCDWIDRQNSLTAEISQYISKL